MAGGFTVNNPPTSITSVNRFTTSGAAYVLNGAGTLPSSSPINIVGVTLPVASNKLYLRQDDTHVIDQTKVTSNCPSSTACTISGVTSSTYSGDWKVCVLVGGSPATSDPCSSGASGAKVTFIGANFSIANGDLEQEKDAPDLSYKNAALLDGGQNLTIHADQSTFTFAAGTAVSFDGAFSGQAVAGTGAVIVVTPAHTWGSISNMTIYNGSNTDPNAEHAVIDNSTNNLGFFRVKITCADATNACASRTTQVDGYTPIDAGETYCDSPEYYQATNFYSAHIYGNTFICSYTFTGSDEGIDTYAFQNLPLKGSTGIVDYTYNDDTGIYQQGICGGEGYGTHTPDYCALRFTKMP